MENKKQKIEEFKLYLKEEKEKYFKKIMDIYTKEELVRVIYFYTNNYYENELKRMSYEQLADIYITELLFKREGWTENKKIN